MEVIDTLEELKTIRDAVVVIRSHGVGKDVYDILKKTSGDRRRHMSVCKKDPPDRGKTDRRGKKSPDRRKWGPSGSAGHQGLG